MASRSQPRSFYATAGAFARIAALEKISGQQVFIEPQLGWGASRPNTNGQPALFLGPDTPPWLANGDASVDTDAAAAGSGGSFFRSLGICRTFGDPAALTTARAQTVNRIVFMRLEGQLLGSTGAAIGVTTTSAGAFNLGLYASSGTGESAVPGAKKAEVGATTVPAAGFAKLNWAGGAVDANEGDWLGFVTDDATTAKFLGNGTLLPQTSIANALCVAQATTGVTLPATATGTFASSAIFTGKVL